MRTTRLTSVRLTSVGTLLVLALGAGACASHATPSPMAGAPLSARTFASVAEAKACARDALVSAGFLPETRVSSGPDGGVVPAETPTAVNGRLVTMLGSGKQVDYASAGAVVRAGSQGDTTATVWVRVQTLLWDDTHFGAVQPLSSNAVRARDAVMTQCEGSGEPADYPRSI